MKDNRQALKDSSIISLKDNNDIVTEFTVQKEIGRGGSCIVYEVTYMQDNVQRSGRLKECFPYGIIYDLYRKQSNNICVNPASVESFEIKKNKFKEGCFKQIRLYEEIEGIRNSTVDVRGIYYGNNTIYYLMPCDNGQCYSNPIYENDSIYDVLQTVKSTAVALSHYHQNGYLHLDIKPDNIFILKETRELIKLFDYDSVIEIEEIRKGKIYLSGTDGYSSQELRKAHEYSNIKAFEKIDFSTDIYSLGAVVFRHVFGREVTDNDINRPPIIQKDRALFKDVSHKLFKLLDDFLRKTCLCNKARRYQSIYEKTDMYQKIFIEALDELIELARPLKHPLKKSLPSSITSFQGRQREMQQIKKQLQEGNRQVFLQGQGGIGKTELAIKFAQEFRDVYDSYFVIYNNSMRDTIINLEFENYDNFDENDKYKGDDVIYKDKIDFLSKYDDNTILIIDNFDSKTDDLSEMINEPEFREVVSCGITVLITTRNYFEGCIKIDTLSDDELFEIMRCFYIQAEKHKETMYKIIDIVGRHTLVVELVAKTLDKSRGRITPEDMYLELSGGILDNENFRKVKSNKDNYLSEDILYNHIKKLFDMSQLSDAESLIMSNMSLVPITGMDFTLFADLKGAENEDDIDALIDKGWIQIDSERYTISLHSIVKAVVLKETNIVYNSSNLFLYNLLYSKSEKEFKRIIQVRSLLINICDFHKDIELKVLFRVLSRLAYYEYYLGDYISSINYYMEALSIYEDISAKEEQDIIKAADICSSISSIYDLKMQDYTNAIEYSEKELKKRELVGYVDIESYNFTNLRSNYFALAHLYNCIGVEEKANYYDEKYNELSEKETLFYENKIDIGANETDDKLLWAYMSLVFDYVQEDKKKAYDLLNTIIEIIQRSLPCNSLYSFEDLIQSMESLSLICSSQFKDDYYKVIKLQKEALQLLDDLNPIDYQKKFLAYKSLGKSYNYIQDYQKSSECYMAALKLLDNSTQEVSFEMLDLFKKLGDLYKRMNDFEMALEYQKKALDIYINHMPNSRHEIATIYKKIGSLYYKKREYKNSIHYLKLGVDNEKLNTEGSDNMSLNLADYYIAIGDCYKKISSFKYLKYYDMAIFVYEQNSKNDSMGSISRLYGDIVLDEYNRIFDGKCMNTECEDMLFSRFQKAIEGGYSQEYAYMCLAWCYEKGYGCACDNDTAQEYYEKAHQLGCDEAIIEMFRASRSKIVTIPIRDENDL